MNASIGRIRSLRVNVYKMKKILISGYYGFNNIGDESILKAVIDNLREKLTDIEITVLSQNPESTAEKYDVKAVDRKSFWAILKAIKNCDLLISGGGSLLQDVTSKKSILYYLTIMWMAHILGKEFFIYSQGIGPIVSKFNRKLTAMTLRWSSGIVVRDGTSKELLMEMGINEAGIMVTADPVLRVKKAELSVGKEILIKEGFHPEPDKLSVGFAIREKKVKSDFVQEVCICINRIMKEYKGQVVLIPFHFSEDMNVVNEIISKVDGDITVVKNKYLTEEMLSIIGNMDVLVGVRLHSLIHAAIMDVPMIAVSYDPKINAFMHSIDMKAMCSILDFNNEFFIEEFDKTLKNHEKLKIKVRKKVDYLISLLDTNEEMIKKILYDGENKNEQQ